MKLHSLSDLEVIAGGSHTINNSKRDTSQEKEHDGRGKLVRVYLDTNGRKGKKVTMIADLRHNPATMKGIAWILKHHCGAGGTVKNGNIEIQGDHRTRVTEKLKGLNYKVALS